jgi:hypothetical protein
MRIEHAHRGELAVHRRDTDLSDRRRQHRDLARPSRRGKLQPGDELADVLQPGFAPVQAPEPEKPPQIFHVVGIGLHRVRRPADIGEQERNHGVRDNDLDFPGCAGALR